MTSAAVVESVTKRISTEVLSLPDTPPQRKRDDQKGKHTSRFPKCISSHLHANKLKVSVGVGGGEGKKQARGWWCLCSHSGEDGCNLWQECGEL